jgi:DNA-directed RNA polymerase specialized sigma24 family protein
VTMDCQSAIEQLPLRYAQALRLCSTEEYDIQSVATSLGIESQDLPAFLDLARSKLANLMQE